MAIATRDVKISAVASLFGLSVSQFNQMNTKIAMSENVIKAGTSFDAVMRDTDAEGDLMYLARLVYSEATSNSPDDMYAVASVVINRMKRPELGMGTTIKDVIDKPGAFNGRTSERFDAITKGFYHIADVKNWNQSLDAAGKAMIKPMPEIKGAVTFHSDESSPNAPLKGQYAEKYFIAKRVLVSFPTKHFFFRLISKPQRKRK